MNVVSVGVCVRVEPPRSLLSFSAPRGGHLGANEPTVALKCVFWL